MAIHRALVFVAIFVVGTCEMWLIVVEHLPRKCATTIGILLCRISSFCWNCTGLQSIGFVKLKWPIARMVETHHPDHKHCSTEVTWATSQSYYVSTEQCYLACHVVNHEEQNYEYFFLYELKLGYSAPFAVNNINIAFAEGTANERWYLWNFVLTILNN